ncbi:TonB-dependent receptor domain-containing protein [Paraliomyxa miuraensis]|uniref:TonB-dependent receptor domain-containing protein n=1 Tax=Paraliomyxa miuraensis TaxID=376150 RepID=UPI00225BB506|nr:TonB-dependent receptor [Paraliomyxa miuraensis]MCX4239709.1 TonB-dependent receptor [Paraliomyxa miuraensis]
MSRSPARWAAALVCLVSLWLVGCTSFGGRGGQATRDPLAALPRDLPGSPAWTGPARPSPIHAYTSPGRLPELRDATGHPLPLRHTGVHAALRGHVAAVKVRQRFHNPKNHAIEVVYTFPLPENSAVSAMTMFVGDRTFEAEIMRREQARQAYEDARASGHTASLLEQERPNVFTQSVANIPPGQDVEVEIRYVQTLTYDAGEYELVFPMVVGPRFDPGDGSVPDAARVSPPVVGHGVRTGHDIELVVDAQAGPPIVSWTCPTHEVEATLDDGRLRATLVPHESLPNRDFVLRYRVGGGEPQAAVLLGEPDAAGNGHYLMVVHPPETDVDAEVGRREVIFVVDRSGSMHGAPLALAKQTVRELLARLRPVDTFDVVGFASGTERLFGKPRPANAENLVLALAFLDAMESGGGTMMADAVEAALRDQVAPGMNRYVLFLTDGYVSNEYEIFAGARALVLRLAKRGNVARVFGIGIGAAPNRELIAGIAVAGNGSARTISSREHPARAVDAVMHDIDRPVITGLSLPEGSALDYARFPGEIPDLFVSQPVVVMGRYHGDVGGSVELLGHRGGQALRLEVPVHRAEGADGLLTTLWARAKVAELETHLWEEPTPELEERITRVGLAYRIVTPFTSFIAVDRSRVVGDGNPEHIEQPVAIPEGVDPLMSGARAYEASAGLAGRAAPSGPSPATHAPPMVRRVGGVEHEMRRAIRVAAAPVSMSPSASRVASLEQYRQVPAGSTGRDFTQVVDTAPTASRDAAGISLAGTTGAESRYTMDGATVNDPAFGTVGIAIVQEFIEEVEVLESGYEAKHGGASGGQINARRISGTNRLRGQARFTFTPRLAEPRFVIGTDEAVRTVEIPEYTMQGVVTASGPIIRDRLFWSAGVSVTGGRNTLVQSFHHRIDADGSGGFGGCPHDNGAFDCAPGRGHIATEEFASQRFVTGQVQGGHQLGLDWSMTPRHQLHLTVGGAPRFVRRSYRHAPSDPFDPPLLADPRGGRSLVANGLLGDHLGWDRHDSLYSSLGYSGRLFQDRMELEATLAYSRFGRQTAWRLDHPELRELPATQYTDAEGGNLFELLDAEGRLDLLPEAAQVCNEPNVPGQACPVRQWITGGLGQYGEDRQHRAEARLDISHYFNGLGSHMLGYGAAFEHLVRRTTSRYSGSNRDDFGERCQLSGLGTQPDDAGGEWCFDPSTGGYLVDAEHRVDNHRFVMVDLDDPDRRTTLGYGRARKEQGRLDAIATPDGAGIRAAAYDETLSTQNYALYLQDRWAMMSNLHLHAGARWELQDMHDVLGERALFIRDNVGPRVGLVYDWTDEGRSRAYVHYGMFFQPLPLQLGSRVFGGLIDVRRSYRDSQCQGQQVVVAGESMPLTRSDQPTEFCTDTPVSTTAAFEGGIVPRLRGQYDHQLQLGYDQEVVEDLVVGIRWLHTALGRAVEDVSTDGGGSHLIANPGEAVAGEDVERQRAECTELDAQLDALAANDPGRSELARTLERCRTLADALAEVGELFDRPRRSFDAFSLTVTKRFGWSWWLMASYTYSRLQGNYEGFVDPITGLVDLGRSVQYDTPELVRNSFGPLSFDTPHRLKLDGFYSFDLDELGRLTLGTNLRVSSGYPISLRAGHPLYDGAPVYVLPRGAGGRIRPNATWGLSLGYAYPLPAQLELEATVRILNVTNARATMRVDETYSFQDARAVAGGDAQDLAHAKIQDPRDPTAFFQRTILARQGNYGVETAVQAPLAASFELLLRF